MRTTLAACAATAALVAAPAGAHAGTLYISYGPFVIGPVATDDNEQNVYGVPCPSSPMAVPVLGVIYAGPERLTIYGPNTVVSCFN